MRRVGFEIVGVKNQPERNNGEPERLTAFVSPGGKVKPKCRQGVGAYLQAYINRIDQRVKRILRCAVFMLCVMLAGYGLRNGRESFHNFSGYNVYS